MDIDEEFPNLTPKQLDIISVFDPDPRPVNLYTVAEAEVAYYKRLSKELMFGPIQRPLTFCEYNAVKHSRCLRDMKARKVMGDILDAIK